MKTPKLPKDFFKKLVGLPKNLIQSLPNKIKAQITFWSLILGASIGIYYLNEGVYVVYGGTSSLLVHLSMTAFSIGLLFSGMLLGQLLAHLKIGLIAMVKGNFEVKNNDYHESNHQETQEERGKKAQDENQA